MSEAPSDAGTRAAVRAEGSRRSASARGFFLPYAVLAVASLALALFRVGSIAIAPSNTESVGVSAVASSNSLQSWNEALIVGNGAALPRPADPALRGRTPGSYRVRLGDVVSTDATNLMLAAMWDDRFAILPPSGAPATGSPQARTKPADDDSLFVLVGMVEKQPEQKLAPPEIYNPPSKFEAPNAAAPPNSPGNLEPRESSLRAGTTAEIVTSATMMALLKADAQGASTVTIFQPSPGSTIARHKWADATSQGISRVWRHLRSVGVMRTPLTDAVTYPAGIASLIISYLATPLPFPGGASFTEPKPIDFDRPPADIANLFNPAFSVEEPVTILPAIAFMAVSAFGFLLGRRRQTVVGGEVNARVAGAISVAALLLLIVATRDLWRQVPNSWAATVLGLLFIAFAAAAVELWVRAALRSGTASKAGEAGKDNALRSVLYRDTPIDDVSRERLEFQVLVSSLRRFLDNLTRFLL